MGKNLGNISFENLVDFPEIGDEKYIFLDASTNIQYTWDGANYITIVAGSGGSVTSVNGQTGVVVLSESDLVSNYAEKTANYTITLSDYTINCTSGTFTVTLPTAIGITGRCFEIINTGSGLVTLDAFSTQTIEGDLTQTIYQDECFVIRSTGANWIII